MEHRAQKAKGSNFDYVTKVIQICWIVALKKKYLDNGLEPEKEN